MSGVLASLVSVLLLAKMFGLSHEQYVTLLPKSITTAIGMGVSEELGGIVTITVAVIIITGVLGNVIADIVYKIAKIEEPVAKGLALGTCLLYTSPPIRARDTSPWESQTYIPPTPTPATAFAPSMPIHAMSVRL